MSAWGGGQGIWFVWTPKYALVSLLHLAQLPPVSAVSPLKAGPFSWELRHHPNPQHVAFVLDGLRLVLN